VACEDRFTAFIGGIGSGKSYAGAVKALHVSAQHPGGLGLVISPTYPMLRDATLRTFMDVFGPAVTAFNKSEMVAETLSGEVLFRSADNPDRLRGPNLHWGWIDEGGLCPPQTWEITIGRLRADGMAGPCWVTTTPKGRNWLYEQVDQMTVFRAATRDNPYLAPEFVASLEAAYTGQFAKQELLGEFVAFEGLVYDEFTRERHVVDRDAGPFAQVVAGVDEGYTNPAVILPVGFDVDGRAHVLPEWYARRVLQEEMVAQAVAMRKEHNISAFHVDPSAAGLIAAMRNAGLPVMEADNRVRDGIQNVKARLACAGDGRPRLTVSPRSPNTIAEFESYVWKQSKVGVKDEPEKANDHAMDALRYVLMGRGGDGFWL